jgi:hypothetical protein
LHAVPKGYGFRKLPGHANAVKSASARKRTHWTRLTISVHRGKPERPLGELLGIGRFWRKAAIQADKETAVGRLN